MKNNKYILNTVLTVLITLGLSVAVLVRTFCPVIILPKMSIPAHVLISVIALVIDHYLAPEAKRCYICIPLFAGIAFGLLPYAAGFITPLGILIYGAGGAAVFTVVTILYSALIDRLSSGPAAKATPVLCGLGLYLASCCFMGIIL